MKTESLKKYRPYHEKFQIELPDRQWPSRVLERAPAWCSVDLRDGNQALPQPMSVDEKLELFQELVRIGFKQIEVGFPSASDIEFAFMRRLVKAQAVPEEVRVQVLVQAREHLIRRTFESLQGFREGIVHLYNSTSRLQRRVTFGNATREKIKQIAVDGAKRVHELADQAGDARIRYQYSPESFSDTELDYAYEVCRAVLEVWEPTPDNPVILNLPVTVEWTTPNVHADQIEWFCRQLQADGLRQSVEVSLHTHNDRGTGVACTELALLAGADRVEGTLFGNGERTGNLDIVTVALNLNSHGIPTGLDFSDLPHLRSVYERVTRMRVPERHPYAGDLVFTAFSGSHQDAIKKGMDLVKAAGGKGASDADLAADSSPELQPSSEEWAVPYLTIDPEDIGRSYEAIIRINSQSGKGGVAWVLEREFGYDLPRAMHPEVGAFINKVADRSGRELTNQEIFETFAAEFINREAPLRLNGQYELRHDAARKVVTCEATVVYNGEERQVAGQGNGPINAFVQCLADSQLKDFRLVAYHSHALGSGSGTDCAAYVAITADQGDPTCWGCGVDPSIEMAGLKALVSAYNRLHQREA